MMPGFLRRRRAPRILLDLREGGGMRGLHLAASLSHLAARSTHAEFWALHGDDDDTALELALLRQDSGQFILRWQPDVRGVRFDLLVAMADGMPVGATWRAARRVARHALVGLMFPDPDCPADRHVAVANGHDTRAFADRIAAEIQAASTGFGLLRRLRP